MNEFGTALIITLAGMGLVFAAILAFWALMAVLVRVTSKGHAASHKEHEPVSSLVKVDMSAEETELRRRTAVAAVAFALACEPRDGPQPFPVPPTALVSTWQAVLRARQLGQRGSVR